MAPVLCQPCLRSLPMVPVPCRPCCAQALDFPHILTFSGSSLVLPGPPFHALQRSFLQWQPQAFFTLAPESPSHTHCDFQSPADTSTQGEHSTGHGTVGTHQPVSLRSWVQGRADTDLTWGQVSCRGAVRQISLGQLPLSAGSWSFLPSQGPPSPMPTPASIRTWLKALACSPHATFP